MFAVSIFQIRADVWMTSVNIILKVISETLSRIVFAPFKLTISSKEIR
jgi:hypothetical protein